MVELSSTYVQNVGALVVDLAQRGLIVRVGFEESIIGGATLMLQVSRMTAGKTQVIKEALKEEHVIAIPDVRVVGDALMEKLKKS